MSVPEIHFPKTGRPRRGTEEARHSALIHAATKVFLRDGYGSASIDKVATEAGVSTRTIYERFKNKADLLGAVINRLVDRMATVLATADLDRLEPRAALRVIGTTVTDRTLTPECTALFRIVASESHRFPELAAKMRGSDKQCVEHAVADYFRGQAARGTLNIGDADRAAALFMQMVCSELHENMLFGTAADLAGFDLDSHLNYVIDIFLLGVAPR